MLLAFIIYCWFQLPMGVLFKNENLSEDMISILKKFQSYLPFTSNNGDKRFVNQKFGFINGVDNVNWPPYGGQFTLSTPLIKPNFCILLPHRRSTTVSLETTPSLICESALCRWPIINWEGCELYPFCVKWLHGRRPFRRFQYATWWLAYRC